MENQSQNSGKPTFCANNCGFFGDPATNSLCSKCYKECLMKQSKELVDQEIDKKEGLVGHVADERGSCTSDNNNNNAESRPANSCSLCKKRVGLMGFRCRCGQTFCSLHRYSDKHNCVFDYKGAGQDAIARDNPVVKADKIDKI